MSQISRLGSVHSHWGASCVGSQYEREHRQVSACVCVCVCVSVCLSVSLSLHLSLPLSLPLSLSLSLSFFLSFYLFLSLSLSLYFSLCHSLLSLFSLSFSFSLSLCEVFRSVSHEVCRAQRHCSCQRTLTPPWPLSCGRVGSSHACDPAFG